MPLLVVLAWFTTGVVVRDIIDWVRKDNRLGVAEGVVYKIHIDYYGNTLGVCRESEKD